MISVKELYEKYKKPRLKEVSLNWWGKLINIISVPITIPFLYLPLTPLHITIIWMVLGIVGASFFAAGTQFYAIIGAI